MKSQIQLLIFRLRSMSFCPGAVKCKGEGCRGEASESPQLEVVGRKVRTGCVHTSVSGSKWIVTAAHCLHEAPDSEGLSLHDLGLFSPSAFKIIMGECGPS